MCCWISSCADRLSLGGRRRGPAGWMAGDAAADAGTVMQDYLVGLVPVAVMMDMGVASPRAQGQAMINTATALMRA